MTEITIRQAKALCTSSEYELVLWSTNQRVRGLDAARLRAKRDRARRLRDKFRDLANQQRREMRGKGASRRSTPAGDNRNTLLKSRLFQETIDRFEAAMDALSKKKAKTVKKKSGGKKTAKKPDAKKTAAKKTVAKKSAAKKTAAKKVARKAGTKKPLAGSKKTTKKAVKKSPAAPKKTAGRTPAAVLARSGIAGKKPARRAAGSTTPALESRQTSRREQSADATRKTKSERFERSGNPKIHGHISSRDRRNQSRRDSRN